jgi:LysM repeat protein
MSTRSPARYGSHARYRSPARYLAPLALAAFVAAVVARVTGATSSPNTAAVKSQPATLRTHGPLRHYYQVRPGDSLLLIALRNGVSVTQVEQLNPGLDPNALHPGQWLKLRT